MIARRRIPQYPSPMHLRALDRVDSGEHKPTLRVVRGQYAGCVGSIGCAAMLEDGTIAYIVRVVTGGCVMRVAMGEHDVEAL